MAATHPPGLSPAREAALAVLGFLGVDGPPLVPHIVLAGLRLSQHSLPTFDLDRLTQQQRRAFGSVRGLLSPQEARIYLSADLAPRQEPWVIYHEAGHAAIEWHREMLFLDTTHTLSPDVRILMEREANEFAGDLLFLGRRFAEEARALPFGIASVLTLASRYDASIEATMRRYIETASERCVCNVFAPIQLSDGSYTLKLRYFTRPSSLRDYWDFGCKVGDLLPPDDEFVALLNGGHLEEAAIYRGTRLDPATGIAYAEEVLSTGHAVFAVVRALPVPRRR